MTKSHAHHPDAAGTPTVLHVVESLAGGVATAIESYVRSTPNVAHFVLGHRRLGAQTSDALEQLTKGVFLLPSGHVERIRCISETFADLRPDIVHAHSSWAGAYVRLSRVPSRRILYTPHCYAFERLDLSPIARAGFWIAESLLKHRTRTIVAVGDREADLAAKLPGRAVIRIVPQVAPADVPPSVGRDASVARDFVVTTMGRVCNQKDPEFFAAVARRVSALGRSVSFVWIGGGDPAHERSLRSAGVVVTGWISRSEALARMSHSSLYIHTASWEGYPMTLLEAAAAGLPVIVRCIPALRNSPIRLVSDPSAMATGIIELIDDPTRLQEAEAMSVELLRRQDRETQGAALVNAYAEVLHDRVYDVCRRRKAAL